MIRQAALIMCKLIKLHWFCVSKLSFVYITWNNTGMLVYSRSGDSTKVISLHIRTQPDSFSTAPLPQACFLSPMQHSVQENARTLQCSLGA